MKSIRIDDEVWERIKSEAVPLEDTPNSVLRRLLLSSTPAPDQDVVQEDPQTGRASPHELLDVNEYTEPILSAVDELGGQAKAADIMRQLEETLVPKLKPKDLLPTPKSGIRWMSRAHSHRYQLIRDGLLQGDSPFGYWTITELGREWLTKRSRH